jgi:exosortase
MTQASVTLARSPDAGDLWFRVRENWPLSLGFACVAWPTFQDLAHQSWSNDFGAYGPIVLVTGAWLLGRRASEMRRAAVPGNGWLVLVMLIPSLAAFVAGHAYDIMTLEAGGLFGIGVAMLYAKVGLAVLAREWFPLLYLAFAIPPPTSLLQAATAPLKEFVSQAASSWVGAFGIPVAREGVTIFVAQYQLLVEDACSGMNSIVGLTAVSLLYIYLVRGSNLLYALALTTCVVPIAIFANILRIMVLILLTYFFGNEVAQGFLHFMAGLFLFSTAILFVFMVDKAAAYAASRLRGASA